MRKLKLLLLAAAALMGVNVASAQASFNHTYTVGVEPAAGGEYFLYNIGVGQFLTSGLNYGTRATVDNSGRVLTLSKNGSGFNIYTNYVSLNNRTDAKAGYLTTNGYVDTGTSDAAWVFESVSVDGYTNAYTIKNSDTQYLFFDRDNTDPGCPVNVGNNTGNNDSYWLLIPKASRETAGDYTHYLINTQMNCPWEFKTWGGSTGWNDNTVVTPGGRVTNRCGEKYHAVVDIYQDVKETLPNGRYKLYAQGFWRQDGSAAGPVLYANTDKNVLAVFNANGEGTVANMDGASDAFSAGQYVNSVETFVSDGSLRVGINITDGSQWVIFDNFVLDYLGQCVMDYAVALPDGGAMEADTWYYFDITAAADNYLATATTLSDIICTTDGYTLTSASAGNVTLKAEDNSFVAQRYYVKSSSANNLAISVAAYSYTISEATADITLIQEGKTVTISYNTSTNDPNGSLTQDYSGVTFGGEAISVTPTVAGFTFTVPTVTANTNYTLSIPEGAIKYNDDNKNVAQNITLKTPLIFDGTYYLYNPYTTLFLGRGHDWGTAAVADKYGIPFNLVTGEDGYSTIKFVDNNAYLFNTYWLFADGGSGDNFKIELQTVGDYSGYAFINKNLDSNNRMYVYVNDGNGDNYRVAGNAIVGDNCANEAQTVWQIKTVEEHNAIVNAYPTENIQNVITASGIDTTTDGFEEFMAANYGETDMTNQIGTATFGEDAGSWTWSQVRGQENWPKYTDGYARLYHVTGSYTQTIDAANLPAGIYKVKMAGFDRRGENSVDESMATNYGSVNSSYLLVNDQQVRIKSWKSMYDAAGQLDSWEGQKTSMDNEYADNVVYIYLDGSTDLKLTVAKPNYCYNSYMCFGGFTLTYYEAKATTAEKAALAAAITAAETKTLGFEEDEYAPYNNVAALEALAAAKAIVPETAFGKDVVAATEALTGAAWTQNATDVDAIYNGHFAEANGWNPKGWTRSNGAWGQQITDLEASTGAETSTAWYYNTEGAWEYGNDGVYTMPLAENQAYKLTFKYRSHADGSNNWMTASVLNDSEEGLADVTFAQNADATNFVTATAYFTTGAAGNYILSLTQSGNTHLTDVSLVKVASAELALNEGTSYEATDRMYYESVALTRTVKDGFNTVCLPFDLTAEQVEAVFGTGTKVYTFEDVADGENSTINFKTKDGNTIEANVPVLIGSATASTEVKNISNVLLKSGEAIVTGTNFDFVGTYDASMVIATGDYFIGNGAVYKSTGSTTIAGFRAYIKATTAGARIANFNIGDGETTGIGASLNDKGQMTNDNVVYNLNGQRVQKAQKGLYIQNGKKVIVK